MDAVAADVLDEIAKRRSAADRERAEKEERELAIGALEALRRICNHALGRADVPPEAQRVRSAPATKVKREEETPSHRPRR